MTPLVPQWITGLNASISYGALHWKQGINHATRALATTQHTPTLELWWPWNQPVASTSDIDELTTHLHRHRAQLVALNLWAGDMAAGERGVVHKNELPPAHLEAVARIAEATGVRMFNLVLGRGGKTLHTPQRERLAAAAERIHHLCGGTILVEPLSGLDDYPITNYSAAAALVRGTPHTAILLDFYHLHVAGGAGAAGARAGAAEAGAAKAGAVNTGAAQAGGASRDAGVDEVLNAIERGTQPLPRHVQVADIPGRGRPGSGSAPLEQWVKRLRGAGYSGEVIGEWLPTPQ